MNKKDIIYFAYKFDGYKPRKKKWQIYCCLRKFINIREKPSKLVAYCIGNYKVQE